MSSVLIIAKEKETAWNLHARLAGIGHAGSISSCEENIAERIAREVPDLVIIEAGSQPPAVLRALFQSIKTDRRVPVIALVTDEIYTRSDDCLQADDIIIQPFDDREFVLRIDRLLKKINRQERLVRFGDLVIDLANCDVKVAGKRVELTFKEYELLTFLVKERGRVFTRETLLNKVWGYDYFGGDRTVDVHVRRLRSKIETTDQTFIETVRNFGYRFKKTV